MYVPLRRLDDLLIASSSHYMSVSFALVVQELSEALTLDGSSSIVLDQYLISPVFNNGYA